MDPFTIGGLAAQGVGVLGKLFGGNAEQERQNRVRSIREFLARKKAEAVQLAAKRNAGMMANSRQAAMTRAAAAGRSGEAESYILPAEYRASQVASENVDRAVAPYNQAEMNVEQDFANRPIEPGAFDYLGELGSIAADYGVQNEAVNAMRPAQSTPDLTVGPPPEEPFTGSPRFQEDTYGKGYPMDTFDAEDSALTQSNRARKSMMRAQYPKIRRSGLTIF